MAILDDTRADWNARPPTEARTSVPWSQWIGVSWHWLGDGKGPSAAGSHQKCLDQVREWQGFHQRTRGWKDIGYNVLICQHARAIEGRGLNYSGSHSPGVNYKHLGFQFMCGSGDPFPSPAMIARAVRLRADVTAEGKNIRRDWAHRDDPEASTECCGDELAAWVHSGGPTRKSTTPSPAPQEDDEMAAADVTEIKAYIRALLIDGYTANGVDYPGIAKVDIENQKRIAALTQSVATLAAAQSADKATLDAVLAAVKGGTVDLDAVRAAAREGSEAGVKELLTADVVADVDVKIAPKDGAA